MRLASPLPLMSSQPKDLLQTIIIGGKPTLFLS